MAAGCSAGLDVGADALIPAELIAELARSAKLRPLIHPADEPGAATFRHKGGRFVRCRDLTCRFPGCDGPPHAATLTTPVPHGDGGPTSASNLKGLCRRHHLMKTFWGWRTNSSSTAR